MASEEDCWCDQTWLLTYSLTRESILEYFAYSPFYDRSCDNEILRMQQLPPSKLAEMHGVQYSAVVANHDHNNPGSHFFIIQKTRNPEGHAPILEDVFYCVAGIIYHAPTMAKILDVRLRNSLFHLGKAFNSLKQLVSFDLDHGHQMSPAPVAAEALPLRSHTDVRLYAERRRVDMLLADLEKSFLIDAPR